jgi:hypothetical protein
MLIGVGAVASRIMMPPSRLRVLAVGGLLVLSACGGGNVASKLVSAPAYQPKDQTKCSVEKSQAKPLVVEWPSADRGDLETRARRHGLVVVRYQGCEMQVLDACTAPIKYAYSPMTRKRDRVQMRDADSLYANIPVGAAGYEAELEKSGELDVDMTLVGRWEAERSQVRADELQGTCGGATHVVSALTVGSFLFTSGADATVGGGASVLNAGVGANSTSSRKTLGQDGDESACEKATSADTFPPDNCGGALRVEVVPIGDAPAQAPSCPDGTQWDGSKCVGKQVVTQVQCPAGTSWNGSQCVGTQVVTQVTCPAGSSWNGTSCVAAVPPFNPGPSPTPPPPATGDVDRGAVLANLSAIAATVQSCKKPDGPTGTGHVKITYLPDGTVQSAVVDQPPFAGTAVGGCVAGKFRSSQIPAFRGSPLTVGKSFVIN